jgi:hypothetical protein
VQPLIADATTALVRAIRKTCGGLGGDCTLTIEKLRSRAWASVTFTGARHEIGLLLKGADAQAVASRFSESLDVAEFRLRGHILADIALMSNEPVPDGVRLRIEALTVEE